MRRSIDPRQGNGGIVDRLGKAVRTTENLYRAWCHVRARARMSSSRDIRTEFERIDDNPIREIRRIQRSLNAGSYIFEPQRGHTKKKKSGGRRAIVVAGLTDRIVQRAILNVLQSETPRIRKQLGTIPNVLSTPTSVGGVPGQNVAAGIGDVRAVIRDARTAIDRFSKTDERRRAEAAYTQAVALIDRKIRGWGDAFSFVTNRLPYAQLDRQLDEILGEFRNWHVRQCKTASPQERRRMTGVALLADSPPPTHAIE